MEWKDIKPLKENEAREIVKEYLLNHRLSLGEINPDNLPEGKKSPDFVIKEDDKVVGYCEVKTPAHNLNPITQLYQWDTTFYKLRRFLHTAKKQFGDYDPRHKKPWVIIFTSNHPQLNWKSFTDNIIGAVAFNGQVLRDFRNKKFLADSDRDLLSIDMVVWFQVNYIDRQKVYQVKFFINKDRPLLAEVEKLSNRLKPDAQKRI